MAGHSNNSAANAVKTKPQNVCRADFLKVNSEVECVCLVTYLAQSALKEKQKKKAGSNLANSDEF